MIRLFEENEAVSISVFLKNGEKFERKDMPAAPVGQNEVIVSFWEGDSVVVYPLTQVEKFIFHLGDIDSDGD